MERIIVARPITILFSLALGLVTVIAAHTVLILCSHKATLSGEPTELNTNFGHTVFTVGNMLALHKSA